MVEDAAGPCTSLRAAATLKYASLEVKFSTQTDAWAPSLSMKLPREVITRITNIEATLTRTFAIYEPGDDSKQKVLAEWKAYDHRATVADASLSLRLFVLMA